MNASYVNPFLEAAALVYMDLLGVKLLRGRTSIKQSPRPGHEIAIVIEAGGAIKGNIVYSVNIETVYKIVRKLMPGSDDDAIAKEYKDVMGELGNMITGNALNIFMSSHADLDLSVPMVVDTRSSELKLKDRMTLGLNMYSSYGILEINIAIAE